ncbi:uncharacterized protein BT62DRAFT_1036389 [Guyanagaster necrorhizus]|uniref:Uncharacterized protein n=1 Tax=Guyanagaster necrorhizus TaxID=856835 RepID=A0A9P7VKC3_9AGAR|nr:uncharacterized protein BT62DRAFT_1036389 [Guyanagaster necrorhizus MCA 3950]KAG7442708.1 hypothetical protein BT62DRAFT_1036389 [Guyanagaster necrorhizus MCA 3950]
MLIYAQFLALIPEQGFHEQVSWAKSLEAWLIFVETTIEEDGHQRDLHNKPLTEASAQALAFSDGSTHLHNPLDGGAPEVVSYLWKTRGKPYGSMLCRYEAIDYWRKDVGTIYATLCWISKQELRRISPAKLDTPLCQDGQYILNTICRAPSPRFCLSLRCVRVLRTRVTFLDVDGMDSGILSFIMVLMSTLQQFREYWWGRDDFLIANTVIHFPAFPNHVFTFCGSQLVVHKDYIYLFERLQTFSQYQRNYSWGNRSERASRYRKESRDVIFYFYHQTVHFSKDDVKEVGLNHDLIYTPPCVSYLVSVDTEMPKKHRIFSTERFKSLTKRVKWRRRQADLSPLHELQISIEKPLLPTPTEEYTTDDRFYTLRREVYNLVTQDSEPMAHMSTLLFRDLRFSDPLWCLATSSLRVVDETEAFTPSDTSQKVHTTAPESSSPL